ncbi:hypothetical protein BH09BAC3_BH09BAC3_06390 [soil metagenome]
MKRSIEKKLILSLAFSVFSLLTFAQERGDSLVKIKIKNSSILPRKCVIVSYAPNETGNGTQGYWFLPGGEKQITFKEGTKLFLANQQQVDIVMAGKRIENQKPFLVVKKEDNNKTFKF